MNNLGFVMLYLNKLVQAEKIFQECLEIRRQINPLNRLDICQSMNNLGLVL